MPEANWKRRILLIGILICLYPATYGVLRVSHVATHYMGWAWDPIGADTYDTAAFHRVDFFRPYFYPKDSTGFGKWLIYYAFKPLASVETAFWMWYRPRILATDRDYIEARNRGHWRTMATP